MSQTLKTLLVGLIFVVGTIAQWSFAESTLLDLHRTEPYDALAFNDGYLFVGKSKSEAKGQHLLLIFDRNDQIVKTITMPHSVEHIYEHGNHEVLVLGTATSPSRRFYSIVKISQGQFDVRSHEIAINAWGNDWLGTFEGKEYFTDFGGNTNDPEGEANPSLPSQTVFVVDRSIRTKFLSLRMRSPIHGIIVGQDAFIARFYQLGELTRNIYKLNLSSGTFEEMFPSSRDHLSDMIALDHNLLAVTESGANRILFVERTTKQIVSEVAVEGYPRSMQKVGHCLVVGAEKARQVKLISIKNPLAPNVVGGFDFSATNFGGLKKLSVDPLTGKTYGRSAYVCNHDGCRPHWNSVAVSTQADTKSVKSHCL